MKISIIVPSLNDSELLNTVSSIIQTSGDKCQILVIDDQSKEVVQIPQAWKNVQLIRNEKRIGVAKSRHLGAEKATGDVLLFLDAHMRCEPGWYEAAIERLEANPNTLYNGCVPGLSAANMDISKFAGKKAPGAGFYTGAKLCLYNPADKSAEHQVLEGKWKNHEDNEEMSCMMGAQYYVPRDIFFKIGGLKSLLMWGTDEPFLSLKAWLAGYEIRQLNTARIGHKFRNIPDAPYRTENWCMPYNKMRAILTILPDDVAEFLMAKLPETHASSLARKKIAEQREEIARERESYQAIFTRDLDWFCAKFPDVKHPLK